MATDFERQSWQREMLNFKGVKSLFILEGNVNDKYPDVVDGGLQFSELAEVVRGLFEDSNGSVEYNVAYFDPIQLFSSSMGNVDCKRLVSLAHDEASKSDDRMMEANACIADGRQAYATEQSSLPSYGEVIRSMLRLKYNDNPDGGTEAKPLCVIVNMASRLLASSTGLMPDETQFFLNLYLGASKARLINRTAVNTLILVTDNVRNLPVWFIEENPFLRTITLPHPDRDMREAYIQSKFGFGEALSDSDDRAVRRFIDTTDGMSVKELEGLQRMYQRDMQNPDASIEAILPKLVDVYKYGFRENKWQQMFEKLEEDPEAKIKRRVKGQDEAVEKAVTVLKRSVMGLSGATHSSGSKPKGVLFLSGPPVPVRPRSLRPLRSSSLAMSAACCVLICPSTVPRTLIKSSLALLRDTWAMPRAASLPMRSRPIRSRWFFSTRSRRPRRALWTSSCRFSKMDA